MTNISEKIFKLIEKGETEECKKLIKLRGHDINDLRTKTGLTPLMCAIIESNDELIEFFLEEGQDVNLADRHGETALTIAALRKEGAYVYKLLEYEYGEGCCGVNINHQNKLGLTALHYAVEDFGVCKLLLDKGADTTIRISEEHFTLGGMTAAEVARDFDHIIEGDLIDNNKKKNKIEEIEIALRVLREYKPEVGRSITWAVCDVINFLGGKIKMIKNCPHYEWEDHSKELYSCLSEDRKVRYCCSVCDFRLKTEEEIESKICDNCSYEEDFPIFERGE